MKLTITNFELYMLILAWEHDNLFDGYFNTKTKEGKRYHRLTCKIHSKLQNEMRLRGFASFDDLAEDVGDPLNSKYFIND